MDEEAARRIVRSAVDFDPLIVKLRDLADGVDDPALQAAIRGCADTVMGLLNRDVILPLVLTYPGIDPDR